MGNQFPKSEIRTFQKWRDIGFTWNLFFDEQECEYCNFTCKTFKDAKEHSKTHTKLN